jgi:hypothetical protein
VDAVALKKKSTGDTCDRATFFEASAAGNNAIHLQNSMKKFASSEWHEESRRPKATLHLRPASLPPRSRAERKHEHMPHAGHHKEGREGAVFGPRMRGVCNPGSASKALHHPLHPSIEDGCASDYTRGYVRLLRKTHQAVGG